MQAGPPTRADGDALWQATLGVVRLLVAEQYADAVRLSRGVRLTAEELREAVRGYGRSLEAPPSPEAARFSPIRVAEVEPPTWAVACDLWSGGEPTDLTLELTLRGPVGGAVIIEIDDLHVL